MSFVEPVRPCGTGVLVLAGSSGRVDNVRAELFARHGALSLPLQWFGGVGLQPGPWEVPVETFIHALDALASEVDRLAIVGTSFGAEAALITGALDHRVDAVAAFAPTSVAWAAYDTENDRMTSKWTYRGVPVPSLPVVKPKAVHSPDLPTYLPVYEHSLRVADPGQLERATIAVEQISKVLLVSGGDDKVWPSAAFAKAIEARRASNGLKTQHVHLETAGHRAILPTEGQPDAGPRPMARGGSLGADSELGNLAWTQLSRLLDLHAESR
ncbi:acyl-CoA thioester hydrolase/BAAT C-terminal domain-containing protein [Glutamicibacter endophyticus]